MEISSDEIRVLIEKSGRGDKESYRLIYEHMIDRVFAYLKSRTGTKDEAADITQDVFVELWKALPRFTYHSREQFYAYVFVSIKRKLFQLYGARHKETVSLDEETFASTESEKPGDSMHDEVTRALATLDSETREIVVLHHWSRYTFGEIAVLINMTENAVRVRHHRALKILRAHISKETYA